MKVNESDFNKRVDFLEARIDLFFEGKKYDSKLTNFIPIHNNSRKCAAFIAKAYYEWYRNALKKRTKCGKKMSASNSEALIDRHKIIAGTQAAIMKICAVRKIKGDSFCKNVNDREALRRSAELAYFVSISIIEKFSDKNISNRALKKLSTEYPKEYKRLMLYYFDHIKIADIEATNAMLFGSSHTWYAIELALLASTKN